MCITSDKTPLIRETKSSVTDYVHFLLDFAITYQLWHQKCAEL